jgi:RimJ/RimL family protein N-acetyltransferase
MRREVSRARVVPVSGRVRPDAPLTDGVVTVRLPQPSDAEHMRRWASPPMLEGIWISGRGPDDIGDPGAWTASLLTELLDGWTETGSITGPALVIDEAEPCVGLVYITERPPRSVELSWGVTPPFRRRGIASRAGRITSDWILTTGVYDRVELRIDAGHPERMRVAERAGFTEAERIETYIEGTGRTAIDAVFTRER